MENALKAKSTHQKIAIQLRSEIVSGVYEPGTPMREIELAKKYGVSRSPIRQVLHQLTNEGWLCTYPNRGTFVSDTPCPEVMAIISECRAKLECVALRQCFHELSDQEFDMWHDIIDQMYVDCKRGDFVSAYNHDDLFHRVLIHKASPAGSMGVYDVISRATSRFLSVEDNRPFHSNWLELHAMHASLYEMFQLGDLEIACEALWQHILRLDFVTASYECGAAAGYPREFEGVYVHLADGLRESIKQKS